MLCARIIPLLKKPPFHLKRKIQKLVKWPHDISMYPNSCWHGAISTGLRESTEVKIRWSCSTQPTGCFWYLLIRGLWALEFEIWLYYIETFSKGARGICFSNAESTKNITYIYEYTVSTEEKKKWGIYEYLLWKKGN